MDTGLTIGVDASRNRSGGARAHLIGIISSLDPVALGIREVHLWSFSEMLEAIPDFSWLIKHKAPNPKFGLLSELLWQKYSLSKELEKAGCDILFSSIASTLCRFKPMVVLSQDLLSYEPGIMNLFGYSVSRLRLILILFMQNKAFRLADGVIFLTEYAAKVIQKSCGPIDNYVSVPHGVNEIFNRTEKTKPSYNETGKIKCLYVSPVMEYKHQLEVVKAITLLKERGYDVSVSLVGGGSGKYNETLDKYLDINEASKSVVEKVDFLPLDKLPEIFSESDIYIFASSCEAFGIALLEGMRFGLPIACSNRSCLPELLEDGGVYFDPENPESIAGAVEEIIKDEDLRQNISTKAAELSKKYSWARCSKETWEFIVDSYHRLEKNLETNVKI